MGARNVIFIKKELHILLIMYANMKKPIYKMIN